MASSYGPRQSLSQKLQQKLSPQQIQLMKLLQIPTATLEQRIEEELEANPALEEGDETADLSEGLSDMDLSDADLSYYEREQKAESGQTDDDLGGDSDISPAIDEAFEEIERETADEYAEEEAAGLRDDDGPDLDDYLIDFIEDDPSTYKTRDDSRGGDQEDKQVPLAFENTFHEYLEQQLGHAQTRRRTRTRHRTPGNRLD
jgi:RNA polymerase sigma-54 factor